MASAYYAYKKNIHFHLFESSNHIGGNCRTIKIDQFKFDTGAHRFHDKIPSVTKEIKSLLGKELLRINTPSKIFRNDQFIDFPIKIFNISVSGFSFDFPEKLTEPIFIRF